jgi:mRNA interferase YafQ
MLTVSLSSQYKKSIKRYKNNKAFMQELIDVLELLVNEKTLPKKYKDHELKGNLKGIRECHIRADDLLLYFIIENETLKLVDIGSHAKIFRM